MPNLYKSLKSDDGLRGLFCVFFVATLLTFYELYMFFAIVVPQVKEQVDNGIEQVSQSVNKSIYESLTNPLNNPLDTKTLQQLNEIVKLPKLNDNTGSFINYLTTPVKDITDASLQTIKERELRLTNKINNYTKLTGLAMIILLVLFLFWISYILNKRGQSIGRCTWKIAATTVILIFSFQYSFYLYGQNYKYLGTLGEDELVYYLMKQLDKNTNLTCDTSE